MHIGAWAAHRACSVIECVGAPPKQGQPGASPTAVSGGEFPGLRDTAGARRRSSGMPRDSDARPLAAHPNGSIASSPGPAAAGPDAQGSTGAHCADRRRAEPAPAEVGSRAGSCAGRGVVGRVQPGLYTGLLIGAIAPERRLALGRDTVHGRGQWGCSRRCRASPAGSGASTPTGRIAHYLTSHGTRSPWLATWLGHLRARIVRSAGVATSCSRRSARASTPGSRAVCWRRTLTTSDTYMAERMCMLRARS